MYEHQVTRDIQEHYLPKFDCSLFSTLFLYLQFATMTSIFSIAPAPNASSHSSGKKNSPTLVQENKELQKQVHEQRQAIQNLVKKLSVANADVAKSVQSVANYDILEAKLKNCMKERDAALSVSEVHKIEKTKIKIAVEKLEKEIQQLKVTRKSEAEANEEKTEAFKEMIQTVSNQLTELTAAKKAVELDLQKSQVKVTQLEKVSKQRAQNEANLEASLKSLSTERFELTKKVSALGKSLKNKESQCMQLETKVASLAYAKQSIQRDLKACQENNKTLIESQNALMISGEKRRETINAQYGRIQKLETDTAQAKVEVTRLKFEIDMITQTHAAALAEIEDYKKLLDQTQRNMKDREMTAQETQTELEHRLTQLKQQKESLKGDVDLTISYLQATREEVANLRTTVQERDQRIEEEKKKLAAMADSESTAVLNEDGKITASISDGYF